MLGTKALGLIFANMHDSAVGDMTATRSMASLPFGGRYRLIDFCLSSLVGADVSKVGVITKSNYHSLMDHLGNGQQWDLSRKRGGLSIFPPNSFFEEKESLYQGRIQALNNILPFIKDAAFSHVVLMDCDYVCNIDVDDLIRTHIETNADVTVVCRAITPDVAACQSCVAIRCDADGRAREMYMNKMIEGGVLSMNVFVVAREPFIAMIAEATANMDRYFERDILAKQLDTLDVRCYLYGEFSRRIYSVKSYYDANMALLDFQNLTDLFRLDRPVYTKVRDEAPVRYGLKAEVKNALLADGCIINGAIENSVIFRGVRVEEGAQVHNSILMQNTVVKAGANLNYVISDKDVAVGAGRTLEGSESYPVYIKKASVV